MIGKPFIFSDINSREIFLHIINEIISMIYLLKDVVYTYEHSYDSLSCFFYIFIVEDRP